MTVLARALMACLVGVAFGCKSNTIDLDTDPVNDDATMSSGGSNGLDDGLDDGQPTTVASMTADGGDSDATDTTQPGVIEDGVWLLALEATPLAPGLPLQFLAQIVQVSPGTYNLSLQPFSLEVGSTTAPRLPVGDVLTVGGLPLGGGAPLQFYTGVMTIPAEANPFTGSEMQVDLFFDGMEIGNPFCGVVSGAVVSPIQTSLDGSTFATTRLSATDPASLPIEFPMACP